MSRFTNRKMISVSKPTDDNPDDWCGTYADNTLDLSYIKDASVTPESYVVCVWGADDIGFEIAFSGKYEARELFLRLEKLPVLNIKLLRSLGFKNA